MTEDKQAPITPHYRPTGECFMASFWYGVGASAGFGFVFGVAKLVKFVAGLF